MLKIKIIYYACSDKITLSQLVDISIRDGIFYRYLAKLSILTYRLQVLRAGEALSTDLQPYLKFGVFYAENLKNLYLLSKLGFIFPSYIDTTV